MSSRTQYVVTETLISMAINTAISIGFVFLVFHGRPEILARGAHGVVLDMAPQTFMVVLMSCLVPSLLTRKRRDAGILPWHSHAKSGGVSRVWVRAVLLAAGAACLVLAVSWATLPQLIPAGVSFVSLAAAKALFGMLLAAAVTPWAILRVLR